MFLFVAFMGCSEPNITPTISDERHLFHNVDGFTTSDSAALFDTSIEEEYLH